MRSTVTTILENIIDKALTLSIYGNRVSIAPHTKAEFPGAAVDSCRPGERAVLQSFMARGLIKASLRICTGAGEDGTLSYVEVPVAPVIQSATGNAASVAEAPVNVVGVMSPSTPPVAKTAIRRNGHIIQVDNPVINKLAESMGMKVEDPTDVPAVEELGADLQDGMITDKVENAVATDDTLENAYNADVPPAAEAPETAEPEQSSDNAPNIEELCKVALADKDWAKAAEMLSVFIGKEVTAGKVRSAKDKSFDALVAKFSK